MTNSFDDSTSLDFIRLTEAQTPADLLDELEGDEKDKDRALVLIERGPTDFVALPIRLVLEWVRIDSEDLRKPFSAYAERCQTVYVTAHDALPEEITAGLEAQPEADYIALRRDEFDVIVGLYAVSDMAAAPTEAEPKPQPSLSPATPTQAQPTSIEDNSRTYNLEGVQAEEGSAVVVGENNRVTITTQIIHQVAERVKELNGPTWLVDGLTKLEQSATAQALGLIAVFGILLSLLYVVVIQPLTAPPALMTSDWNVAVAGFVTEGNPALNRRQADIVAATFASSLGNDLAELASEAGFSVTVRGPEETGIVRGRTPEEREKNAARLAERINAQIVIYGTIEQTETGYTVHPQFYIGDAIVDNLLDGTHDFGEPVLLAGDQASITSVSLASNTALENRSKVLTFVARGLTYYFIEDYEEALRTFQQADSPTLWAQSNLGREVVKLFIGNAAGRAERLDVAEQAYSEAQMLNADYARAYIGLGGVTYARAVDSVLQGNVAQAITLNEEALTLFDEALNRAVEPQEASVDVKVALAKGQSYVFQYNLTQQGLPEAVEELQFVIERYEQDETLARFAAEAYARLGLIESRFTAEPNLNQAVTYYETAITLSNSVERQAIYAVRVADIHERLGQGEQAQESLERAVKLYVGAIAASDRPGQTAELYAKLAGVYAGMGDTANALNSYRDAIRVLTFTTEADEANLLIEAHVAYLRRGNYRLAQAELYTDEDTANQTRQQAVEDYLTALDRAETALDRGLIYTALGEAYEALGDAEQAAAAYQSALDNLPEGHADRLTYQSRLDALRGEQP